MSALLLQPSALTQLGTPTRRALYQGDLFCAESPELLELVGALGRMVSDTIGVDVRELAYVHRGRTEAQLFELLQQARGQIRAHEPVWRAWIAAWFDRLGADPGQWSCDVVRLRAVSPAMHTIERARAAFAVHRDTWYANPQAQLNVWLPLLEMTAQQSFGFYPSCFNQAVENDSHLFDFDAFMSIAGFQGRSGGRAVYPQALDTSSMAPHRFAVAQGQALVFSASHLHGTLPNLSDRTRWSIDVRVVHRADEASGRGAANLDNRSTGAAGPGYQVLSPR